MIFSWFDANRSVSFGRELADFVVGEISASTQVRDFKFSGKVEKTLARAERRIREFKSGERLNFYKKSKLANAFLWELRDKGLAAEPADQLTEWLTVRL